MTANTDQQAFLDFLQGKGDAAGAVPRRSKVRRPYLYFAYGSNLNLAQMRHRCPQAEVLGAYTLQGWQLAFRGVADCIETDGAECTGGLFKIYPACEDALDRYEGFPRLYGKQYVTDPTHGLIMLYTMNKGDLAFPNRGYLSTIKEGYTDFGLDRQALFEAIQWTEDHMTPAGLEADRRAVLATH